MFFYIFLYKYILYFLYLKPPSLLELHGVHNDKLNLFFVTKLMPPILKHIFPLMVTYSDSFQLGNHLPPIRVRP